MNKGDLTRQRIIAQAAPLFNQRGFAGCSMQDIMQVTGLEKGGIYRHFTSKEDLAVAALRYSLRRAVEARLTPLTQPAAALDRLRHAIHRFVEVPSPIAGGCPLMNTAIDADDGNPALLNLARDTLKTWKRRLERIVRIGIRAGEIIPDTDPRRIANLIIATLEGALLIARLEGSRTALHDARATLDTMLSTLQCGN
jgi:AcrR family transcriptional regulator